MSNRRHSHCKWRHFIIRMKLHLPQAGKQMFPHREDEALCQSQWQISGPQRLWLWGEVGKDTPFSRSSEECKQYFFNITKKKKYAKATLEKILDPSQSDPWQSLKTPNFPSQLLSTWVNSDSAWLAIYLTRWWVSSLEVWIILLPLSVLSPAS